MKYKHTIGDRFQSIDDQTIYEVIECVIDDEEEYYHAVCVDKGNNSWARIGDENSIHNVNKYWIYLGNFKKANNFDELYNLLNN